MGIRFIPDNVNINFVKRRNKIFLLSLLLVLASIFGFLKSGLNYGIDFKGGYVIEARFDEEPALGELREKLADAYAGEISLQQFGANGNDIVIKLEKTKDMGKSSEQEEHLSVINKVKSALGDRVLYRKIETIGPTIGEELVRNAIKAVILSLLAIAIYIGFRFEWQFSISALLALAQDCLCLVGAYAWFDLEFNASSIVAVLTTASYSINDTIVIFDRIRENIRRYKKISFDEIINKSINETLSRTVLTAGSTLLAILALCVLGGKVIESFSLPILIGIGFGTFSSIAVSAPLLLLFKIDRDKIEKSKAKKVSQVTL
ncbi:MAG: protein translocase subunit SecF [Holosporales bacterium]|jgi:preprotein translocase SecF subunit|nr:protein translocase subunit SecF [Holosporales bacterium]